MTFPDIRPIPKIGCMTTWCNSRHIDVLCLSADWYKMSPIRRYLMNMAANHIAMEDAKTERREYTYERFELLRQLFDRSNEHPWETAWEAFCRWWHAELVFGVVHLEQEGVTRGDIIAGDEPLDLYRFAPADAHPFTTIDVFLPLRGDEGSGG